MAVGITITINVYKISNLYFSLFQKKLIVKIAPNIPKSIVIEYVLIGNEPIINKVDAELAGTPATIPYFSPGFISPPK